MSAFLFDLKFAARLLRKSPGFTAAAILIFALGIGATTAIFAVVHAELIRSLPYPEPGRLVSFTETDQAQKGVAFEVSLPNFEEWRARSRDFEEIGIYNEGLSSLLIGSQTRRTGRAAVSAGVFPALKTPPLIGRGFAPGEEAGQSGRVALISHRLWESALAARRDVLGATIRIDGEPHTVIGVMPASFDFPSDEVDLWTPLVVEDWMRNRAVHIFQGLGRLRQGATVRAASANLARIAASVQKENPGSDPGHGAAVRPLREALVASVRPAVLALSGAVGLVWLIACADLAGLLLSRARLRRREIGIRIALGAGRARLARGMIVEGALLGLLGGIAAFALYSSSRGVLLHLLPANFPRSRELGRIAPAFAFSLGASVLSGIAFSFAPILNLLRSDLSRRRPGRDRALDLFVIVQVSVCLVLLGGTGLLCRSFLRLSAVDLGFSREGLLTAKLDLSGSNVRTRQQARNLFSAIAARVSALPGVVSSSATSRLPVSGGDPNGDLTVEGLATLPAALPASYRRVLPGYFRTMQVPIVAGRDFEEGDDGARGFVTIVSKALADRFWPGQSPLGRRIKVGPAQREPWLTIVGVAGDVKNVALDSEPQLATYEPYAQRPSSDMSIVVRTRAPLPGFPSEISRIIRAEDPGIVVYDAVPMARKIEASLAPRATSTVILIFFGAATLLLSATGLYGLLSAAVSARTREIGIRAAVGARPSDIRRLVLRWAARTLFPAAGLGLAAALLAGRFLARTMPQLLYGVSPADTATFATVLLLLAAVSLLASVLPARRAARIDPMEALRYE